MNSDSNFQKFASNLGNQAEDKNVNWRDLHFQNYLIKSKKDKNLFRSFEILPGFLAWFTLLASIILTFFFPIGVALFIIVFDVYWLIRVVYLSGYLIYSYRILKQNIKTNWLSKLDDDFRDTWRSLSHLLIMPTYNEDIGILKTSFAALVKSNYPLNKMMVVLAVEERAGEEALKRAAQIKNEYGNNFRQFEIIIHPKDRAGELAGKGSNEAYAAKTIKNYIDREKIDYHDVIVSVFDIDSTVHPEFFGRLTHAFLSEPDRTNSSFQPIPMFFNNIWQAPAFSRVVAFGTTYWQMMEQGRPERLYTFSSHSMSFKALVDIGFWETNVVSEDSRIFWQCFLNYRGNYKVTPLHMPIYMDSVLAETFWQSAKNQYKQQRRWAYGAENIPYLLLGLIKLKEIPWRKKLFHGFFLIEGSHSWAVSAILIFGLGWLPILVGGEEFSRTVLAQSLPLITQVLMMLAMVGMFVSAGISFLLLPKPKEISHRKYYGSLIFQWVLLPLSTIFFGALPAIDAQTRLMLGKYMGFWVTAKVRKNSQ
ncbi:MAG: hypothetical protein ACD_68C00123G0004 [uncultured bacterium]|nr:MAG: hypothetical protein ACD_68C00123G0004 [uncultured bacterium]